MAIPLGGGPGTTAVGWPLIAALALLLGKFGSDSFSADFVAVLVIVPVAVTVATTTRLTDDPLGMGPMVQTPLPAVYVPALGVAVTRVRPDGSRSLTWTPVAFDGPALWAVTVNVTFEPMVTDPLLAVLSTATSASEAIVAGSVAVSFARLASPPPAMVTLS